mgnify:CR=1 FL=1
MGKTAFIIITLVGAFYLVSWPVRTVILRRNRALVRDAVLFLPAAGGVLLIGFDILAGNLMTGGGLLSLANLALFVHGILLIFGLVYALRYRTFIRKLKRERDS